MNSNPGKRQAINMINAMFPGYEITYVVPAVLEHEFYFQLKGEKDISGLINVKTKIIVLNNPAAKK